MSSGEREEKQWKCGKAISVVNLQRVGTMVKDMREPCLSQSPIKVVITVSKMLKPEKWESTFDSNGKVSGFRKALKLIVLGGVDPSIRPEVWEFLLGCYALGTTAESRSQLRTARRERYKDLIEQCQTMHSSIGTGALAFVVGSKVMDTRTSSKDNGYSMHMCRESSSDSAGLVSVRGSSDSAACHSCFIPTSGPLNSGSPKGGGEAFGSEYVAESYFDFPPLPVTDLFDKREEKKESCVHDDRPPTQRKLRFEDDRMHSFQINNNVDLIMESRGEPSNHTSTQKKSENELVHLEDHVPVLQSNNLGYEKGIVNKLRIVDVPETPLLNATSNGGAAGEDSVSEWLWTLHRIVVDVVRTDTHLEFYEDKRNLARMSDILAVYAWVNPATGYCQGMSDLLSPFVVLFEDNADAFWCFEMLLRRMRENFQMEGPTGVMKQLQALWHILELTDKEMFAHLSRIGAESLHFAFRMLMVLFRRELSFSEALRMWEMMWAADFDESVVCDLEENCLQALVLNLPRDSGGDIREESVENSDGSSRDGSQSKHGHVEHSSSDNTGIKSASTYHFCGFTRNFWSRNYHVQVNNNVISSTKNGDDELPVFCVAVILIMNRQKIIKETRSIDDMIKAALLSGILDCGFLYNCWIFNDRLLSIHVKRCISAAIKLRKKYFYKLMKSKTHGVQNDE
ncbi:hypothetical protein NC653_037416 [Populus alba x Populus x berolinensis]|uniref:Rab-GAP TBC domain-containing protein n=1 Tax=Populus alba x Populus x berolinensis TaxID=444605 RepID=A0AAD6PTL5_9ROSI|nr:hypothetical protein NC653_037416 [Populus alba x Populus x berolinensis]